MCENWERRAVPAKQKKTSSNDETKKQKYTNNKTIKPNHKYTNKTIKTSVSRHNLVVLIMGVCTIGSNVWNKDGYGRREYVEREMYNLKLKWAIGKRKWYTVDIKNSCYSTILSVIIGRDKYISVLFFKSMWAGSCHEERDQSCPRSKGLDASKTFFHIWCGPFAKNMHP